jgi:hypothetical protein
MGSPTALTEAMLDKLSEDFELRGGAAIQTLREYDPSAYLRLIAAVILDIERAR